MDDERGIALPAFLGGSLLWAPCRVLGIRSGTRQAGQLEDWEGQFTKHAGWCQWGAHRVRKVPDATEVRGIVWLTMPEQFGQDANVGHPVGQFKPRSAVPAPLRFGKGAREC